MLTAEKLTETVGAEVFGVDRERLRDDEELPAACLAALEEHGVLVFRGLHLDDALDETPARASVMTAHTVAERGGETEFASTYAAYESLSPAEKERFAGLRVVHTFEAIQRRTYPNPTPAQEAEWASRPVREHPLVWRHESGRRSLVFGATASHIDGLGRSLLDELETVPPHRIACCATAGLPGHGDVGQHRPGAPSLRLRP